MILSNSQICYLRLATFQVATAKGEGWKRCFLVQGQDGFGGDDGDVGNVDDIGQKDDGFETRLRKTTKRRARTSLKLRKLL